MECLFSWEGFSLLLENCTLVEGKTQGRHEIIHGMECPETRLCSACVLCGVGRHRAVAGKWLWLHRTAGPGPCLSPSGPF